MLDIFQFAATYAPTAEMAAFVTDGGMQAECLKYVLVPDSGLPGSTPVRGGMDAVDGKTAAGNIDGTKLVEWYCSLKQGQSLKSWCMEHAEVVGVIDIRRFITFGVIKGLLYRIHKYAVATPPCSPKSAGGDGKTRREHGAKEKEDRLAKYLDGTHCFDEICTDLMMSETELMARLKVMGDVQIIQR